VEAIKILIIWFSAGYYTKNGILKYGPDKNDRYNFRAKINSQMNKYVDMTFTVNYNGELQTAILTELQTF